MAIVGSASKGSRGSPYSGSSTDDYAPSRQKQVSPITASFVDSDGSDETENNDKETEICQIGEDTCAVPIELFDLPDLKSILSLDTWNFCLTEDEREFLASFLPSLDEEDFKITMRDLLGGQNFHFGSPLADLFERIKGGSCTPQVARYNEGLKYVQRKKHYYLLRKYHNQMVNSFLEMQKSWEHCPKSTDIDERLEIWSSWKADKQKPLTSRIRGGAGAGAGAVRKPRVAPNLGKKVPLALALAEARRVEVIPASAPAPAPPPHPVVAPSAVVTGGSRLGSKGVLKMKVIAPKKDQVGSSRAGPGREPGAVKVPAPKGVLKLTSKALVQGYTKPEATVNEKVVTVEPKRESVVKETRAPKAPKVPRVPKALKEPKLPKGPRETKARATKAAKVPEFVHHDESRSVIEPTIDKKKRSIGERKRKKKEEEERLESEKSTGQEMYGNDRDMYGEGQRMYGEGQLLYEDEGQTLYEEAEVLREDGRRKKKVKISQTHGMYQGGYHGYEGLTQYEGAPALPHEGRRKKNVKASQEQRMYEEDHQIYDHHSLLEEAEVLPDEGRKKKKIKVSPELCMYDDGHQTLYEAPEAVVDDGNRKKKVKANQDPVTRPEESRKMKKGKATAEVKRVVEWRGHEEGKTSLLAKKKVQRKKLIDEKKKAQGILDAEEAEDAEEDMRLSDLMKEDSHYEREEAHFKDDEVPKAAPKKRPKKKAEESREEAFLQESASDSPRKRGASVKSSKKLSPLSTPSISSAFSFSVTHLLSAVRMALIMPSGGMTSDFHIQNGRLESFHYEFFSLASSDELSLEHCELSPAVFGDGVSHLVDGTDSERTIQEVSSDVVSDELSHLVGCTDLNRERRSMGISFAEIVRRVQGNSGDPRILETDEPLHNLVRGALKVFSSRTAPPGSKGWKPLANFDKESRTWSWTGPIFLSSSFEQLNEVQITSEAWGIPQKTLTKMEDVFAIWLKHGQETLQQVGQLPLPPSPLTLTPIDEKERFRDLRAQKSLMTINPSSDDMRAYFRREEVLRYSLPDRAFPYTTADARKSVVAPLRSGGGKPTSKARDHFILKPDRPPHVTILCLVRDAAARLPGSIGTRADVCTLIRDSQYIVEDVSDVQVNQVVSGALDRLHYERDPCVKFDGERKLWMYLHTVRQEEDFEDDGTSSTKRWKKPKKGSVENGELGLSVYDDGSPSGAEQEGNGSGMGIDVNSPSEMGNPDDLSAIYSVGKTQLVYSRSSSLSSPRVLVSVMDTSIRREESELPFLDLQPSLHPGCVDLHTPHPVAWERVGLTAPWIPDNHHLHSHEPLGVEDYDAEAAVAAQRDADAMIDTDTN